MAKKKRKKVAMATKRRKPSRKELLRRKRISRGLKAYHRAQRRLREPTRKAVQLEEVRRPEESLGDFILKTIRGLEAEQKPTPRFEVRDGQAGGFDVKEQHPDLPRRFNRNEDVVMSVVFSYFSDEDDSFKDEPVTLFFNTGATDEEFWHNYHAALRAELAFQIEGIDGGYQDFSVFVARIA